MQVETRLDGTPFAPGPRRFYGGVMHGLAHRGAAASVPVFRAAWHAVTAPRRPTAPAMVDMASGYGVVSALMRYHVDREAGRWRPRDLQAAPFHPPAPLRLVRKGCSEFGGAYADKSLGLWRAIDLPID